MSFLEEPFVFLWLWVKKETLGDHRFGLFFHLPIGYFRYPFSTQNLVLTYTHISLYQNGMDVPIFGLPRSLKMKLSFF